MNLDLSSAYSYTTNFIMSLYESPIADVLGVSTGYNFSRMLESTIVDYICTGEI